MAIQTIHGLFFARGQRCSAKPSRSFVPSQAPPMSVDSWLQVFFWWGVGPNVVVECCSRHRLCRPCNTSSLYVKLRMSGCLKFTLQNLKSTHWTLIFVILPTVPRTLYGLPELPCEMEIGPVGEFGELLWHLTNCIIMMHHLARRPTFPEKPEFRILCRRESHVESAKNMEWNATSCNILTNLTSALWPQHEVAALISRSFMSFGDGAYYWTTKGERRTLIGWWLIQIEISEFVRIILMNWWRSAFSCSRPRFVLALEPKLATPREVLL